MVRIGFIYIEVQGSNLALCMCSIYFNILLTNVFLYKFSLKFKLYLTIKNIVIIQVKKKSLRKKSPKTRVDQTKNLTG